MVNPTTQRSKVIPTIITYRRRRKGKERRKEATDKTRQDKTRQDKTARENVAEEKRETSPACFSQTNDGTRRLGVRHSKQRIRKLHITKRRWCGDEGGEKERERARGAQQDVPAYSSLAFTMMLSQLRENGQCEQFTSRLILGPSIVTPITVSHFPYKRRYILFPVWTIMFAPPVMLIPL